MFTIDISLKEIFLQVKLKVYFWSIVYTIYDHYKWLVLLMVLQCYCPRVKGMSEPLHTPHF